MKTKSLNLGLNNIMAHLRLAGFVILLASVPAFSQTVLRTQVYHQLTAFTNLSVRANGWDLALAGNGQKIVFPVPAGSPQTNYIYTINFDGTGLTLADALQDNASVESVGISDDGAKVMWADWSGLARVANSDGSNPPDYSTYRR